MALSDVINKKIDEIDKMNVNSEEFEKACKGLKTLVETDIETCKDLIESENRAENQKKEERKEKLEFGFKVAGIVISAVTAVTGLVKVITDVSMQKTETRVWCEKTDELMKYEYDYLGIPRTNVFKDVMNQKKL